MYRRDCCLKREIPRACSQGLIHQRQGFRDLILMPTAAILILERYKVSCSINPGIAPCIME